LQVPRISISPPQFPARSLGRDHRPHRGNLRRFSIGVRDAPPDTDTVRTHLLRASVRHTDARKEARRRFGRSDRSALPYGPADRPQRACFPCPFSAARSRMKMSRFSPLGPGIGQAISFDDRNRLARVLIWPIPAPNSCVLGVGPRKQCAIRHMPMPSLRLQAGFLAEKSGRFLSILLC
jgi:hypothetical protein